MLQGCDTVYGVLGWFAPARPCSMLWVSPALHLPLPDLQALWLLLGFDHWEAPLGQQVSILWSFHCQASGGCDVPHPKPLQRPEALSKDHRLWVLVPAELCPKAFRPVVVTAS